MVCPGSCEVRYGYAGGRKDFTVGHSRFVGRAQHEALFTSYSPQPKRASSNLSRSDVSADIITNERLANEGKGC
jgi:hypothetical protein